MTRKEILDTIADHFYDCATPDDCTRTKSWLEGFVSGVWAMDKDLNVGNFLDVIIVIHDVTLRKIQN